AGNQIGVKMDAGPRAQKTDVIGQPVIVLPAADQSANFRIEGLNADLQLQCAGRKPRDQFAQGVRKPVGNHFKMDEQAGPVALMKKLKDGFADADIQVERAVNKLEKLHPTLEQSIERIQQGGQRELPHRNVQRGEAEFAGERTA